MKKYISSFEKKPEDRLLILVIKIVRPIEMLYNDYGQKIIIFGLGNKITMIGYKMNVDITYNVSTNKEDWKKKFKWHSSF